MSASAAKLEELLTAYQKQKKPAGEDLRDAVLAAVIEIQETAEREIAEVDLQGG